MKNEQGELAMQIISDYPLYCSTSGITYEEAIAIAKVIVPDGNFKAFLEEDERIAGMSKEELEAELKEQGAIK